MTQKMHAMWADIFTFTFLKIEQQLFSRLPKLTYIEKKNSFHDYPTQRRTIMLK